jgi:dihydroorotase
VTTWVDAGSAGAYTFEAFRKLCIDPSPLRVRAFVNISAVGLVAETGEASRPELCDAQLCAATIQRHRDVVVGVKCRLDRRATGSLGTLPLRRALEAAANTGVPVMAHIGDSPPEVEEVLDMLRPGDILTHYATGRGRRLVDQDGGLRANARLARERGVLFDLGHGAGGFSFPVAEALIASGVLPDVISSDAHQLSVAGPMVDLPTCMTKILALGVGLEEVVQRATIEPARAVGLASVAGTLEIGMRADVAVLEVIKGDFVLHDVDVVARGTRHRLVSRRTIVSGRVLEPLCSPAPALWAVGNAGRVALA